MRHAAIVLVGLSFCSTAAHADAMARLTADKLKATHEAVQKLANERLDVPFKVEDGTEDVRAVLHCHSHWSHDSRGTIEEILSAAKATGVKVIMFTEHPADHYDYINDGHQGLRDGILLIPGAETGGMLVYPLKSLKGMSFQSPQEQSDMTKRTGGLAFISHVEERMDWEIPGITGTEMYNTHADVKEETKLYLGLTNPLFWLQLRPLIEKYPQESYSALQDYPKDYLRRFDELCQKFPHTGVAANDAHHNIGIKILRGEKDLLRLEDALGNKVAELSIAQLPFLAVVAGKSKPGEVILKVDMDPYERAFRFVSTHLFVKTLDREGVWEALESGRAYVAFDWIADPTGFVFQAVDGERVLPIGSKVPFKEGLTLRAAAPVKGKMRLIKNGEEIESVQGVKLEHKVTSPGVYRVEVHLQVADEERTWILSNPIYVTKP